MLKRAPVLLLSLTLAAGGGVIAAPLAAADTSVAGTYNVIAAKRLIDTRAGIGTARAAISGRGTLSFQAVSPLGASAASAVALTITAVTPSTAGFLAAYSGDTRPGTSTVNFRPGESTSNSAVVPVDDSGTVNIYNGSPGTVNLAVDATGYWTAGTVDDGTAGALHTVTPTRLYDSKTDEGGAVSAGGDRSVPVAGTGGLPESGASAVVLNATVATPKAAGYLSVVQQLESSDARTSSVNFMAGASRADLVVVPLDENGAITLHNGSSQPLNALLDVVGYLSGGDPVEAGSVQASTTYRAFDDRVGNTPIPASGIRSYALFPSGAGSAIRAAVVTVTVSSSTKAGFVGPLDSDGSMPAVSSLNHLAGQTVAQTMIVPVSSDGSISLRNASTGTTSLVIDLTGVVLNADPGSSSPVVMRRVATALTQARHAAAVRLAR